MVTRQPVRGSVLKGKRPVPPMRYGASLTSTKRPPGEQIMSVPRIARRAVRRSGGRQWSTMWLMRSRSVLPLH